MPRPPTRQSVANGVQGDGSYRISDVHTLRSGFYIQGERSSFNTNSIVLPVDATACRPATSRSRSSIQGATTGWLYSYYLQDEWKIVPKVTVNFGARFDQMAEFVNGRQLSPRVNVVWQPTDATTIKAGYARYFMPPPFELIAPTTISLFANTSAAPAVTLDIAGQGRARQLFRCQRHPDHPARAQGRASMPITRSPANLIDEGQFGAPIILTPFNYQKGLVDGIELTVSYDIDNWSFYGNFAASKAVGKDIISAQFNFHPDELAYIANHFIHLDHDQTYTGLGRDQIPVSQDQDPISADLIAGSGLRATARTASQTASACPTMSR